MFVSQIAAMLKQFTTAIFILAFVFVAVMLAVTIRDKERLKEARKSLILKNDSLHILQLEAKQQLLQITKRLDSIQHRIAGNFKK